MAYNPYSNLADDTVQANLLHHPQPHQQQFGQFQPAHQQAQYPGQQFNQQQQHFNQQQQQQQFGQLPAQPNQYSQFFNDPKAQMSFQVGQNAMMAGTQYVEQEFQKYVPTGAFKYYFKVSNTYVMRKLLLILFPFRNKNWMRSYRRSEGEATSSAEAYAFPYDDTNAPDFYLPLMGSVTYIIFTAMLAGLRGEFSPALLGNQWTMTVAYLLLDLAILKGGLYVLGISSNVYDLVAYVGYKFVPLLLIVLVKNISQLRSVNWTVYIYLIAAYGFFELRAVRFNVFGGINSAQSKNSKAVKSSNYFLFLYAFVGQSFLIWALSLYC